jgi:ABC-type nitrate/sulfonate/bicarbonate transport system substrate-binding protein
VRRAYWILVTFSLSLIAVAAIAFWPSSLGPLRLGLAPYQDLAMIVNIKSLGLEERYGTKVDLVTLPWEEILPSVATLGRGLDVGFASYAEYLTKFNNLNNGTADPVIFIFPLYVFRGGAFVTFKPDIPVLTEEGITNKELISEILSKRIGAQKKSIYEMMIFTLASNIGIDPRTVRIIDTPLDQGFLAAQQGSLDLASAGLTQLTEVKRRGGRVVLTMDDLRFADFTGFIVKKSTYEARSVDIRNLIRMWFDCVSFVYQDLDKNSAASLRYLNSRAATRYTPEEYKRALSQEYLPTSLSEEQRNLVDDHGRFPFRKIRAGIIQYLIHQGVVRTAPIIPDFIEMSQDES